MAYKYRTEAPDTHAATQDNENFLTVCLPMWIGNMILMDYEVFLIALSLQQSFAEPRHTENASKTNKKPIFMLIAAFCKQALSWAKRFKCKDSL